MPSTKTYLTCLIIFSASGILQGLRPMNSVASLSIQDVLDQMEQNREDSSPPSTTPIQDTTTVFADGTQYHLDLSGRDGRDGEPSDAREGLPGADGEDGRDLTVYYTNRQNLRHIYVNAAGGQGGQGSPGNSSTVCESPSIDSPSSPLDEIQERHERWREESERDFQEQQRQIEQQTEQNLQEIQEQIEQDVQELQQQLEQQQQEQMEQMSPPDPPDMPDMPDMPSSQIQSLNASRNKSFISNKPIKTNSSMIAGNCFTLPGIPGSDGEDGRPGQLRIINQTERLPDENSMAEGQLGDMLNQSLFLSRNIWEARSGAADLLAPGSIVANQYLEYVEQLQLEARILWEVDTPSEELEELDTVVTLDSDGEVSIEVDDENVWLFTENQTVEDINEVAIVNVADDDDVTRLAMGRVSHQSDHFTLEVIDSARYSDQVETEFKIRYRSAPGRGSNRSRSLLQTRYEGDIPQDAIERDHDRFILHLDQLPIEASHLEAGTQVEIELTASRSLNNRTAVQSLTWRN